jgi:CubicO group peptidase (beta-lactamase class C family)
MSAAPVNEVQAFLDQVVRDGQTPGAAALVWSADARLMACAGRLHTEANAAAVDPSTVYDLASLTKLLCTTVVAARAVDAGVLSLDETPWPHWPRVCVANVLQHNSGLPDWAPFFERADRRGPVGTAPAIQRIITDVLSTSPQCSPGERTVYSDIGFIALGALLEQRLGKPLDVLFADAARETLDAPALRFVRIDDAGFHPAVPLVAPSERCAWRRRLVIGQVHDENAYALGGVAGHAGLFGSITDVERAGRSILAALKRGGTLADFAAASGERGIGFDRATAGGSTGGVLSSRTVGHLGFTGTSLWLDPELGGGTLFALLTNHVYFGRDKTRILRVRQGFHRAAVAWLGASRA